MSAKRSVRLHEVADIFNGKTPARNEQREQGHPVLKIKDTDEFGHFRGLHTSFVDAKLAHANSERCIVSGDTLILNAAHNATHVASKVYTVEPAVEGALAHHPSVFLCPRLTAGVRL